MTCLKICYLMILTVMGFVLLPVTGINQDQNIITPPKDAFIGGKATFACKVTFNLTKEMAWEFDGYIIYSFYFGVEKYSDETRKYTVKIDKNIFKLEVQRLTLDDGGLYTCTTIASSASAVLLVLGIPVIISQPDNPVEGDTAVFTCEADIGGPSEDSVLSRYHPQLMIFFEDASPNVSFTDTNITQSNKVYHVKKTCSVQVVETMHKKNIFCQLSTLLHMTNITNSIPVKVLYPVRHVSYTPTREVYEVGSLLNCTAFGNPQPGFEWENVNKQGNSIKSKFLNITEEMTGHNVWRCTAQNSIHGNLYNQSVFTTFEVELDASKLGQRQSSKYIIAVLVTILLCAGIVAVLVWAWKKSQTKSKKTVPGMNPESYEPLIEDKGKEINSSASTTDPGRDGSGLPSVQVHNMNPPITQDEGYLQFVSILDGLEGTHDLDLQCKEIIDMFKEQKVKMCDHPDILTVTIRKASILLPSNHFIEIIQKMTSMCNENSFTFQEKPLQCMLELITDEKDNQVVFKYQKTFLQSIQVLIPADCDVQSRTTCLRTLIFNSEYISETGYIIEWTKDFLITVKSLLDAGFGFQMHTCMN